MSNTRRECRADTKVAVQSRAFDCCTYDGKSAYALPRDSIDAVPIHGVKIWIRNKDGAKNICYDDDENPYGYYHYLSIDSNDADVAEIAKDIVDDVNLENAYDNYIPESVVDVDAISSRLRIVRDNLRAGITLRDVCRLYRNEQDDADDAELERLNNEFFEKLRRDGIVI